MQFCLEILPDVSTQQHNIITALQLPTLSMKSEENVSHVVHENC